LRERREGYHPDRGAALAKHGMVRKDVRDSMMTGPVRKI
jgi:hypothetical protein